MGKYRKLPPAQVAQTALSNLINVVPEMKANYNKKMDEFTVDRVAQSSYLAGVEYWVGLMRSPDVRSAISTAVGKAREQMKRIVETARARIAVAAR
jgi:Zn-finger domain-containing protein